MTHFGEIGSCGGTATPGQMSALTESFCSISLVYTDCDNDSEWGQHEPLRQGWANL